MRLLWIHRVVVEEAVGSRVGRGVGRVGLGVGKGLGRVD